MLFTESSNNARRRVRRSRAERLCVDLPPGTLAALKNPCGTAGNNDPRGRPSLVQRELEGKVR